ncbi:tRNA (N(6)-L-threonylcarbamoyladenosine(37)-C(2))-methylthiotransferase MtaB [Parachryseolinea silvisoli]|uniref:tRNA (N(6)-L-threonylcarbamoyladenosine(37)-C(2))- methylthiotransferase MtaB n=1 Tax=Parachryseolinea silvisoli TaxID=2873601 RepID=UPI002265E70B|nr:tRNA (N(6)-L-threonylcarbamoyladenosine(37)-C(2))-methylthiotransferase MtaB [Parachryseolinea silvisoli]MCD9019757.1 tRNA (N(6)-L-threonylcarbamoyladenosine(37)-C(2))-methylthiotransferase MtaB [Parachryseolinea silvisoli]
MKKVAFYTLGCKLNYSETSTISRMFEQKGYQKVDFTDSPDIFIINTCSVTENADKKCHKIVREARGISPDAYVAIIGCYAQLKPKEISEIPGVDAVLGAAEKFRLVELLDGFVRPPQATVYASDIARADTFNTSYSMHDRTRTFLKVQDGCDYSCTFCTIPLARGNSRSDSIENILKTAREIAATDVREVVLTGVNTGDFGLQNGIRVERFIDLAHALDQVEGIDRFRISSIEPNLLTDEIISFVAGSQRFVPHFHIPLQSGSNKILRLMRRRYQRELYVERVAKIRELMPHACIGVDVIVGFPGETQDDFLETYRFLNDLDISYLHVFTYSERENTPAAKMPNSVPGSQRADRSKMLHILSDKKRRKFYEENIGREATVLFEHDIENGMMHGFTENYVRVVAKYDPVLVNELRRVNLCRITDESLLMEVDDSVEETLSHQ